MNPIPQPPLSDAQREIMQIVWNRQEVSVSDVWETLSAKRELARNTVQTMMVRLEQKGWLQHRAVGRTFLYSAAQPRNASLGQAVRQLADRLFGGSAEALMTAFLENESLTKEEADRIRDMLSHAENREEESDSESNSGGKS